MSLKLYNSLSREKEVFEPQNPDRVTMYVCGPTVYNYAHIGNARPPVVFDVLFRLLRRIYGQDHVVYARNITDIEDKIITRSQESGETIKDFTQKYANIYNEDTSALGVLEPTIEPWATRHIGDMIEIITSLLRKNYAYTTDDGVYFHVPSMEGYGALSGRKPEDNEAGARVAIDDGKRDPSDFALWKFAKDGEPEDAIWESPWGRGRPGWHIECSAMAAKHLGKTIDIHGGGVDLQFPHHENEIAQSECAHGQIMANYWLHNGFLDMNGEKMSKSLGNVALIHDLLEDWEGEVLRFALLSGHYRASLDFTDSLLEQSKTTLDRFYGALARVWEATGGRAKDKGVRERLMDDINTPRALAEMSRLVTEANTAADQKNTRAMATARAELLEGGQLLGILQRDPADWQRGGNDDDNARIDALVQARLDARAAKNWAEADRIRDDLASEGIEIMDKGGASTWRRA